MELFFGDEWLDEVLGGRSPSPHLAPVLVTVTGRGFSGLALQRVLLLGLLPQSMLYLTASRTVWWAIRKVLSPIVLGVFMCNNQTGLLISGGVIATHNLRARFLSQLINIQQDAVDMTASLSPTGTSRTINNMPRMVANHCIAQ